MTQVADDDPERFLSHQVEAESDEVKHLFDEFYEDGDEDTDDLEQDFDRYSVAALRRRRRRLANRPESPFKAISLIEEDGVLYWRDDVPTLTSDDRRRRRRADSAPSDGSVVWVNEFRTLAPNKIVAAVGALDKRLNPDIATALQPRLRSLRLQPSGVFEFDTKDAKGPFAGRTLLFVHGTFSNANNMRLEFAEAGRPGLQFLNRAMQGGRKYDQVLFFDHPTLTVSPFLNALAVARVLAGSKGEIDVVAHSRGGLVVRWWLEVFGKSLDPKAQVRAVLAGAPIAGTSLAAPDKIQHAMSLVSNIGSFAEKSLKLLGPANPFLWVAGKLLEVVVSVTGALAKTPLIDALIVIAPGLSGQSAVSNNHELNSLRAGPVVIDPAYHAVTSNFETSDPGWQFWRNFRKGRVADLAASVVFPGNNDLVVDTESMTDFGVPALALSGPACDFGTSETVWHCNYFRQQKTVDYLLKTFKL